MFRNQYDSDITTWSPAGRIHQIEYAMEAVKQGSATVGLKSKTHVVLAALKRSPSELSSYQEKVFKIDDHIGISIAGLTADARVLCRFMRDECLNHKFVFDSPMNSGRLVRKIADKSQIKTQRYGKRPYGVGLLVGGSDQTGVHLYYACPSGNYYDYHATAIGSRAQSARTYLEKHYKAFDDSNLDELVKHALRALQKTAEEGEFTSKSCSVSVIGTDSEYRVVEGAELRAYLDAINEDEGAAAPMDTA